MHLRSGHLPHIAVLAAAMTLSSVISTAAETLTRSVSYFTIGGATPEDIERQLTQSGPRINNSVDRHPGATRIQFNSSLTYARTGQNCRVASAKVAIKAEVILPRWRKPAGADIAARLYWEVISSDILRHEEGHISIARRQAREIERTLVKLRPAKCDAMAKTAQSVQDKALARHDAEQQRFDAIEARTLDRRLLAKLKMRLDKLDRVKK